MRTSIKALLIAAPALALAACGDSTDASEEAVADNVEIPADDAMAGAPDPVADENAQLTADEAEADAMEAAETAEGMVNDEVEDAIGDAEAAME